MEQLKCIGPDVYMAYGKVLKVSDPSVDISTDAGRSEVLSFLDNMFRDKFDIRPYGDLTAGIMLPKVDVGRGFKHVVSYCHFGDLPEDAKIFLRKEFYDHADEI